MGKGFSSYTSGAKAGLLIDVLLALGLIAAGGAPKSSATTFTDPVFKLSWEKRNHLTGDLQGGATFTVSGSPFACKGNATETLETQDNNTGDSDPDAGQFQFDNICNGTYTVTETVAPTGFNLDPDATRSVTVSNADFTIGTQSVADDCPDTTGVPDADSADFCDPAAAVTPTLTTEVQDASHLLGTSFPLATQVHDHAALTAANGTPTGGVTFALFKGGTCADTSGAVQVGSDETVALSGGGASSSASSALHPDTYFYEVAYNSNSSSWNDITTPVCEDLEIKKGDPTVSTEIHLADESVAGTNVPLASTLHDKATVTGVGVSGFEPSGNVTFTFYTAGACTTGTPEAAGTVALDGADPGTAHPSDAKGPLHAGAYAFKASYTGNGDYASAESGCEPVTVDKASSSITTTLHNADDSVNNGSASVGDSIHDSAEVKGIELASPGFEPAGSVRFTFFANGTCAGDGSPSGSAALPGNADPGTAHPSSSQTLASIGGYAFKATYPGNGDYKASTSACEPVSAVPESAVTSSLRCSFDVNTDVAGSQFRLIYTPELAATTSKLSASNPGQFFYNVFYSGPGTTTLDITIPAPFATTGAVPVHIYSGVSIASNGQTCFTPGTEIGSSSQQVTGTGGGTLNVTLPALPGGFAYVAIHLNYGWKGILGGCTKDLNTPPNANCTTPSATSIPNNTGYTFSVGAPINDSATVRNENVFKKDPGIGGLVLRAGTGEPMPGVTVEIYDSKNSKLATATTDVDGWYLWAYKYTGKATTFTVKLPAYGLQQTVTMKSNGYIIVDFSV